MRVQSDTQNDDLVNSRPRSPTGCGEWCEKTLRQHFRCVTSYCRWLYRFVVMDLRIYLKSPKSSLWAWNSHIKMLILFLRIQSWFFDARVLIDHAIFERPLRFMKTRPFIFICIQMQQKESGKENAWKNWNNLLCTSYLDNSLLQLVLEVCLQSAPYITCTGWTS